MADIAAHLIDRVLPDVAYRQWVLSVPVGVRVLVLRHRRLAKRVLGVVMRVLFGWQRRKARGLGIAGAQGAGVAVQQRFGDGARLHWHLHILIPDGVFYRRADGAMGWERLPAPTREELAELAVRIKVRVAGLLSRMRLALPGEDGADEGVGEDNIGGLGRV